MSFQSALVILVPEADTLVEPFRSKHDPSAIVGMPAHITINHPFLSMENDSTYAIRESRRLFSSHTSFEFALLETGRFPGTLYLVPFPDKPIIEIIEAVAATFPQSPPYGGMFSEVIPHLTVATEKSEDEIEHISRRFDAVAIGKLPINVSVNEIWLVDNRSGIWMKREFFPLAES